ncbi:hypothetical protein [Aeromicrobium sp. 179-A 4D2 NHS]|uniref:hypothetical protein n=1 Tax=Aeromicrobium sp. 179-A 4D2 NHS TaxID=3142375 RepID=UPI0039A28701
MSKNTVVNIDLPLPMDVVGHLLGAFGAIYPGSKVAMGGRGLSINLHEGDRPAVPEALETIQPADLPHDDEDDVLLTGTRDDGTIRFAPPERIAQILTNWGRTILDQNDAPNFVEMQLIDNETGEEYVTSVARSKGQTPHQMLAAANERADDARTLLTEFIKDYETPDTVVDAIGVVDALNSILGALDGD